MACNKYQGGLIYTIKTDNGLYVGSTCDFAKRKGKHKTRCFNENDKNYNLNVYKNIRENGGEYTIEIYKMFPCNSNEELRIKEEELRKYLNANLNSQKAFISKEDTKIKKVEYYEKNKEQNKIKKAEYYEKNKEQFKIKHAEYREKNKEQLKINQSEKITCECGIQITKKNISRHQKSNKHLKLMELKICSEASLVQ